MTEELAPYNVENKGQDNFDIVVDSFKDLDSYSITQLPIIIVFKGEKNYPDKYVARLFGLTNNMVSANRYEIVNDSLEKIRAGIPESLEMVNKKTGYDKNVIELYL